MCLLTGYSSPRKYHHEGDVPGAIAMYKKILSANNSHAEANHNLGIIYLQSNMLSSALEYILFAIDANPNNWNYKNTLGETYRLMGNLSEAAALFEDAITLNPSMQDVKYNLGLVYADMGRIGDAMKLFNDIVSNNQLNDVSLEAQWRLCTLLRVRNEYVKSQTCLENGLK